MSNSKASPDKPHTFFACTSDRLQIYSDDLMQCHRFVISVQKCKYCVRWREHSSAPSPINANADGRIYGRGTRFTQYVCVLIVLFSVFHLLPIDESNSLNTYRRKVLFIDSEKLLSRSAQVTQIVSKLENIFFYEKSVADVTHSLQ